MQIRPCKIYDEEYSDCTSIKARFQQHFVYGKSLDCGQWKRDFENCIKYEQSQDLTAARELIESEKLRRMERFKAHYQNDVWTKRKSPPEGWNRPLPEAIQKAYENSYLSAKAKELRGEKVEPHDLDTGSSCSIM